MAYALQLCDKSCRGVCHVSCTNGLVKAKIVTSEAAGFRTGRPLRGFCTLVVSVRDFGSLGVRARCSGHPVLSREKGSVEQTYRLTTGSGVGP